MNRRVVIGVAACVLGACSALVGADFEERPVRDPGGDTGGAQATGGAAGDGAGGSAGVGTGGHAGSGEGGAGAQGGSAGSGGAAGSGGSGGRGGASGGSDATGGMSGNAGDADGGVGGDPGEGVVVINEVKGQGDGDDYIEIFNRGPGPTDVGGYGIADASNTFLIPSATTLEAGEYLLLLLGRSDLVGEFTCFTPNPCFHASWGVAQDGEMVYLRDASNTVVDATDYPDQAGMNGLANGESWGRLPNGTGDFVATRLTPELQNQAP